MISLGHPTVFSVAGAPVTTTVVTTWVLMLIASGVSFVAGRSFRLQPTGWQAVVEWYVSSIWNLLDELTGNGRRYIPLIATFGVFVLVANLSSIVPGVEAPTADLNTTVALALFVWIATHYFGIREQGFWKYLGSFAQPIWLLFPINVLTDISRNVSLAIRLFGNMYSHQVMVAVLLLIVPLIVPVLFEVFGLAIGVLQAYIFTLLAAVYIGGAVRGESEG